MERHQIALAKLREFIDGFEPDHDEQLPPERELALELGVGRRSLRRALDVLEEEGRVWRRQGAGTFVRSKPSSATQVHTAKTTILSRITEHTNPIEIMEVRLIVEPAIARVSTLQASVNDIEDLSKLAMRTRRAQSPDEYELADLAFHRRIAKISRNGLLLAIFDLLDQARRTAAAESYEKPHCIKRQGVYAQTHMDLVEAIKTRDAARAETLMFDHLWDVQQNFLQAAAPVRQILPSLKAG